MVLQSISQVDGGSQKWNSEHLQYVKARVILYFSFYLHSAHN